MSPQKSIPQPGSGRITLGLLAMAPAVMAYPWPSTRDYGVLGAAVVGIILLFGWWRGLHFTAILRRRLAMLRRRFSVFETGTEFGSNTRTTALLRIGRRAVGPDVLPLPLIARYLNCYGIRADTIRITNHGAASDVLDTWIGLTVSAVDNLAALQARSSRIPLRETAEVAARRLADHLRVLGWEASVASSEDIPRLLTSATRETWHGVADNDLNYVAAYRISADEAISDTLDAIRSHPACETWTALEIAGDPTRYTVAAACAFRTDTQPGGSAPLAGLTPQRGNHRPALMAIDPLSTQRLDGHTNVPADLLKRFQR